eukprot:TRINITY_DN3564_c1_g2_i3.p1 TRINITY_DN3564_c1_g2~~TRINITY_DN3564_c1_g2_i3.p1  ORF type:complete len:617 (+),score=226.46 TRINITY_DN3564_c1_g2_i3:66-1853(+)
MYSGDGDQEDYTDGMDGYDEHHMDDSLDPVSRLERYCSGDFAVQRLVLVRDVSQTVRGCGLEEATARVLPLLKAFSSDSEPAVKEAFLQQLVPLSEQYLKNGGDQGYTTFLTTFLKYGLDLAVDRNLQVGAAAVEVIPQLAEFVKDDDVVPKLLDHATNLAKDARAEDYRMVAAQLFDRLGQRFGKERCLETVVPQMDTLSGDNSQNVRKTVATNIHYLMQAVGPEAAAESVLPIWRKLCADQVWGVRRACVENCVSVAHQLSPEGRRGPFLEQFLALQGDANRWVQMCTKQCLGEVIHALSDGGEPPAELVKSFAALAPEEETEEDYSECCAFAFPAVVHAVGPSQWDQLKSAYVLLQKSKNWKVRRTLAFSLHEVAAVADPAVVNEILVPGFARFITDLDDVKVGCLSNLPAFLKSVAPEKRSGVVECVGSLVRSENWRVRETVAGVIGDCAPLLEPAVCRSQLQDPTMELCRDQVADVRCAVYPAAAKVIKRLAEGGVEASIVEQVCSLQAGEHFRDRQIFAQIAGHCIGAGVKAGDFAGKLLTCAGDPVANVRIAVAHVLQQAVAKGDGSVASVRSKLSGDDDRDVKLLSA